MPRVSRAPRLCTLPRLLHLCFEGLSSQCIASPHLGGTLTPLSHRGARWTPGDWVCQSAQKGFLSLSTPTRPWVSVRFLVTLRAHQRRETVHRGVARLRKLICWRGAQRPAAVGAVTSLDLEGQGRGCTDPVPWERVTGQELQ